MHHRILVLFRTAGATGDTDSDEAPEDLAFSSSKEKALQKVRETLHQIGKEKKRLKHKRKERNEQFIEQKASDTTLVAAFDPADRTDFPFPVAENRSFCSMSVRTSLSSTHHPPHKDRNRSRNVFSQVVSFLSIIMGSKVQTICPISKDICCCFFMPHELCLVLSCRTLHFGLPRTTSSSGKQPSSSVCCRRSD